MSTTHIEEPLRDPQISSLHSDSTTIHYNPNKHLLKPQQQRYQLKERFWFRKEIVGWPCNISLGASEPLWNSKTHPRTPHNSSDRALRFVQTIRSSSSYIIRDQYGNRICTLSAGGSAPRELKGEGWFHLFPQK